MLNSSRAITWNSENPYSPTVSRLLGAIIKSKAKDTTHGQELLESVFNRPVRLLSSARSAIYLALRSKLKKNDEVLVPEHMSQCVLNILSGVCKPTYNVTRKTKAVIIVHQLGIPQEMNLIRELAEDNNLFMIEDCAQTFDSRYKGRLVGTFGDVSVFSFPKVFSTISGGMICTSDNEIMKSIDAQQRINNSFISGLYYDLFLFLTHINTSNYFAHILLRNKLGEIGDVLYKFNPSNLVSHLFIEEYNKIDYYSKLRKRNFSIYQKELQNNKVNFSSIYYKNRDVTPFVYPLVHERPEELSLRLRRDKIPSNVWHFDSNLNVFSENYIQVLGLPTHQGITDEYIKKICNIIKEYDKN